MTPPRASPQVLALLASIVEERSGLHYGPADHPLLHDKLAPRALDAGFDSLLDYYYYLRYDPAGGAELDALVESLTVHETYLFREADQLRALADALAAAPGPARVWCAACATGEEPLTLAMLLAERGALARVELVASDLSERALARARAGRFAGRSLRALPAGVVGRWLDLDGDVAVARPSIRDAVAWRRVNLAAPDAAYPPGPFDAILCRNVLIYFHDDTTRRVAAALAASLRPGGLLLVGASESLLRLGTSLRCEERGGAFFYVKDP